MAGASADELDSFAGWLVVALGFSSLLLVWGTVFTFTVYADALATTFGLDQLAVSSLFSVTAAVFYIVGGGVGVTVARVPLRPVVLAAAATVGIAVSLLQVVSSYPGLLVTFALFGMAGGTMFVLVLSVVPLWFDAYEGRAMGVALAGNGLGVLVLPFVWVWLLSRVDIRLAFGIVGGALAVVLLVASPVVRRPASVQPSGSVGLDRAWLRSSLTDRAFVVALVGFPLLWAWYFVLSSSLVDILTTAGIARTLAATAFGIVGGVSVLGRLGSGAIADVVGPRETLFVGVALAALAAAGLLGAGSPAVMYVALVAFGAGLGALATLFSPILVNRFGPENATAIIGLFTMAQATTAFGAPIGLSLLFEATGGYAVPLGLLAVLTFTGALLFHWGTRPGGT